MNYKELFNKMMLVLGSPSKAWETIRDEEESEELLTSYVYPLIAICGIALFVGLFFGNGVEEFDFRITLTKCCGLFISLFGGFFLSAYLVEGFGKRMLNDHPENTKENTKKLVGYSMTVIFVLEFFAAIFPSFFIIKWIAQFYLIYVVWEGSEVFFTIDDDKRLTFTALTSVAVVFSPTIIRILFNTLSNTLG